MDIIIIGKIIPKLNPNNKIKFLLGLTGLGLLIELSIILIDGFTTLFIAASSLCKSNIYNDSLISNFLSMDLNIFFRIPLKHFQILLLLHNTESFLFSLYYMRHRF